MKVELVSREQVRALSGAVGPHADVWVVTEVGEVELVAVVGAQRVGRGGDREALLARVVGHELRHHPALRAVVPQRDRVAVVVINPAHN
ncbi:MAG: hypothetical protein LW860_20920 [Xanthomonadaceae bacterium]|nr:hypothetical protein [Xanthomonadaceae bacterium]